MSWGLALGLAPRQCQVCHTRAGLEPCSGGCAMVFYCGREHQDSDRDNHEHACSVVSEAATALEQHEQNLHVLIELGGGPIPYQVVGTPDYLAARRVAHESTTAHFNNVDAVETSIERLNQKQFIVPVTPSQGASADRRASIEIIAVLLLRLGCDQECYEYARIHSMKAQDEIDNMGGADVLEPPAGLFITRDDDIFGGQSLSHLVCVTLIKVRILLDLRSMQNTTRAFQGVLPRELIDEIRVRALVSSVVASRNDIALASVERITELIQLVKSQIRWLFNVIADNHETLWPMLVGYSGPGGIPNPYLRERMLSCIKVADIPVIVKYNYEVGEKHQALLGLSRAC
ncbi:hypothetical protein F5883DRAFT_716150 [Diaporthe sp. PMI_573]|nr:hypothetical protein F5883DRAFT_716150 [Diaporthaceae sp. PMI_573]